MSIWQNDKRLSKQYQLEFERLLYMYLPFTARFFCNLYVPNFVDKTASVTTLNQPTNKSVLKNIGLVSLDSLNYTTERPYDRNETGVTYTLIKDIPIYLADGGTLAETQLKITDMFVSFIQQSTLLMKQYPVIPTFVNSVIQFVLTDAGEQRLFKIDGESKFSAYGYNVNDTIYRLNISLLQQEWNPYISRTLVYTEPIDNILTIDDYYVIMRSLSYYDYAIMQIKKLNAPINYYGLYYDQMQNKFSIIYDITQLAKNITQYHYRFVSFTNISATNPLLVNAFSNTIFISNTYYSYQYNYKTNLIANTNSLTYNLNTYTISISNLVLQPITYYLKNDYSYLTPTTTFKDAYIFWYELLVASKILESYRPVVKE